MNIAIRKFTASDVPNKVKWINDPNNNRYLHYDLPLEEEKTLRWFEGVRDNPRRYDAVIEADGTPVGLIGLLSIDVPHGAEVYISMGETAYKGKGVAKAAMRLLLQYAFEELALERLYLFTETGNTAAQALFERSGFRKTGLLKEDLIYNGKKVDRFSYEIRADECGATTDAHSTDESSDLR